MSFVGLVKKYLCNTYFGDKLVNAVRIRGIDESLYILPEFCRYKRDMKCPTEGMVKSRLFFENNKDRIQRNTSLLFDNESKDCYRKAIDYRVTHDFRRRPKLTGGRYFVKGIIKLDTNEVLIDGGAFVGDTVRVFRKISKNCFKKIICFEPDSYNYKMLREINDSRVVCIQKGLSDKTQKLSFFNNGSVGSKIIEEGQNNPENTVTIDVTSVDEMPECSDVTFIKMDIEGAELSALHGARKTIQNNKPKLAICLYHTDEDMLSIIEYVHELVPEYRLYVRHHSLFAAETVLYAIV